MVCIADARKLVLYEFCIRHPKDAMDARLRSRDLLAKYPLPIECIEEVVEYVVDSWFPQEKKRPVLRVVK